MSRNSRIHRAQGFTLIEVLVIAPIALLVVTGFVALMITMIGDVITSRAQNVITYDTQSAIDSIDQDVRLTVQFLDTSDTMVSPQGKDGSTAAFTSTSGDLVLAEVATDKNPIDTTRSFIYYDDPYGCSDPATVYKNRIYYITVIYTVRNGSLWRRTSLPSPSGTLCQNPWQINTCAPNYSSSATRCQSNDSEILRNVKSFSIQYYTNPEDTATIPASSAVSAKSIKVTIESETTTAGRTINASSYGRSTKMNEDDILIN